MKQTQDLNQMYFFAQVVTHRGFSAASRELGIPKSRLSRQVAQLEAHLGVRLIQRSTRHFFLTEIGQRYFERCQAMLIEAEAAQYAIDEVYKEPCGTLRISCPLLLLHIHVSEVLTAFMQQYPGIKIELEASNRRVDVMAEGFDIAIRARPHLESSDLVAKVFSNRSQVLVAQTEWLSQQPPIAHPNDLSTLSALGLGRPNEHLAWHMQHAVHGSVQIPYQARLITTDMPTLLQAALAGLGMVQLPHMLVATALQQQQLSPILPEWQFAADIIHAIYPSRRGQLPAVRAFLQHLDEFYANLSHEW